MTLTILFKNSLNKSSSYTTNNDNITIEEIYKVILEKFPNYTSNKQLVLSCNGKSFTWTENQKSGKLREIFSVTQKVLTIYILLQLPGGKKDN